MIGAWNWTERVSRRQKGEAAEYVGDVFPWHWTDRWNFRIVKTGSYYGLHGEERVL